MEKQDFIKRVLLIMNEAGLFDAGGNSLLGADTAQVDRHIEGSYVDAWRRCVKVMPRVWFANKSFKTTSPSVLVPNLPAGIGYVWLPSDFYLLTVFKMKGWDKPVLEAYIENERTSSIQNNNWTRGSTIRPVCTISSKFNESKNKVEQALNYYSLPRSLASHAIEEAIYVPVVEPLSDKANDYDLNVSDQALEPLAYLSASTVFTMFEKYDIATALESRAVEMFPGLQSLRGTSTTIKQ